MHCPATAFQATYTQFAKYRKPEGERGDWRRKSQMLLGIVKLSKEGMLLRRTEMISIT
jgi:hypothetical protein